MLIRELLVCRNMLLWFVVVNMVRMFCEIYEDCVNVGNLLSCVFRIGLLWDIRDYWWGNGFSDYIYYDYCG